MLFVVVCVPCRVWVLRKFSPLLSGKWAEKPQQTNFSLLEKNGDEEEVEVGNISGRRNADEGKGSRSDWWPKNVAEKTKTSDRSFFTHLYV